MIEGQPFYREATALEERALVSLVCKRDALVEDVRRPDGLPSGLVVELGRIGAAHGGSGKRLVVDPHVRGHPRTAMLKQGLTDAGDEQGGLVLREVGKQTLAGDQQLTIQKVCRSGQRRRIRGV